jgi:hypothetical protein
LVFTFATTINFIPPALTLGAPFRRVSDLLLQAGFGVQPPTFQTAMTRVSAK